MDFFEKLNELHANSASPKKIKKENGDSKEEVLQKVMDFVDKYDAKQKRLEIREKGMAERLQPDTAKLDMKRLVARAIQIAGYNTSAARPGQAGRAGNARRVGDVTYKFKMTKNGLIVVDNAGRKVEFVVRPDLMAVDAQKLVKGIGVDRIMLAEGERPEGKSVKRRIKNGPKEGPE